ncbi:MAG: phenylalanine--tRNA ligase subunit alpha [Candidatus Woesearchaeota archaeon]
MVSKEIAAIANSLSLLERKVLPYLKEGISVGEIISLSGLKDAEVKRGVMWLSNKDLLATQRHAEDVVILKQFGELAKERALPEIIILRSIVDGDKTTRALSDETGLPHPEIMASIGILKSLQAAEVRKEGKDIYLSITPAGKALATSDVYQPQAFIKNTDFPVSFSKLSDEQKEVVKDLSKRKDMLKIEKRITETIHLTSRGQELIDADIDFSDHEEQLTADMLKDGSWKEKTFRTYDVSSPVPATSGGRRHPMREAENLIRDVYLNMGFQEMEGPWVETAFWCMDSMWIPQDHPARDEQDTFFIGKKGQLPDQELVRRVKDVHETGGGTGSSGHGTPWSPEIAKELVLRTHSTATTFRMFGEKGIKNGKYFYVANVFRNEAVDTTHLAEFIQAEGFVVGDDLTISDLMGFIKEFYARLGIHKIRFKPTYNPYTEPSLEAHYYNEHTKKWYALINSGIFRPESLAPYGLKGKTVIAWGMGASRVAALLTGKTNLRELVGPTVDLDWIATHRTPQPDLEGGEQ